MSGWYRVVLPHYVAAFRVDGEIIVEGPPVMRTWMQCSVHEFAAWARFKGGRFDRLRS